MSKKEKKTIISQEDVMKILDSCYEKCLNGIPKVSPSVEYMAGFDINSDQTQTLVYACLAGVAVNNVLKQASIKFGVKFTNGLIKKIPGKVLTKINQKVGFRFITKFGTKGIVNLGKLLPGVGAVIGGGLDLVETKIIAGVKFQCLFTI